MCNLRLHLTHPSKGGIQAFRTAGRSAASVTSSYIPFIYKEISNRYRASVHQRPLITPHRHTRAQGSRSTPFRQPGATQGAPTAIESAQNARPLPEPSPVPSDGWTDAHRQRSIRPSIRTLTPSTDRPELWNPRDLRGTVLGTRGVHKEKGQRRHRL